MDNPWDWESEYLMPYDPDKEYAILDAIATLNHDWCQWEYQMVPSQRWECEEDWK